MPVQITRRIGTTVTANGALTAGQHTPVNATSGAITVTLPTAPNAGASMSVEKTDASVNTVTITGSLRGATSSAVLYWANESIELVADAANSWWPVAGHKTKTALDGAYDPKGAAASASLSLPVNSMTGNGTALIGARNSVNASAGPVTVAMPAPTVVGQHMIIERSDTSSTAANAITITGTIRGVANSTVTLAAVGAAYEGALYIAESLTSWAIAASIKPRAVLDAAYLNVLGTGSNPVTSASAARPSGLTKVFWQCPTQPTNWVAGDEWINNS